MEQNLEPIRSKIYEIRGHKEEWDSLRFQIGILEVGRGQYTKFLPHAFTEQGLAMLSGMLDAISEALAELQPREPKPRRRIGFIQEE
jgi:hypothetical protein